MSFTIAASVDEALAALAAGARPIAGGSDLVVGARNGKFALPMHLVAIDRVVALSGLDVTADGLRIGATVNHATLQFHPAIVSSYSALADGAALVGSPATRNVGTIGGNVMNASPAMDTGAPLVVLDADVELRSASAGSRRVPIEALWIGPGRTSAGDDELCLAVYLPTRAPRSASAYVRLEYRRAMEIAVVGAAVSLTLAADGTLAALSVALNAVAPTILRVHGLDELLGRSVSDVEPMLAVLASEQARPISDLRASDKYRRHCVGVMARRALVAAAGRVTA